MPRIARNRLTCTGLPPPFRPCIDPRMKIPLPIGCILLLSMVPLRADEAMSFTDLGAGSPLKFAADTMSSEVSEEALTVAAPAPWSCGWQYEKPLIRFDLSDGTKRLYIKAAGSVPAGTTLRVRLISGDWQRARIYEIPLAGLRGDEAAEMDASTVLDEPVAEDGGGFRPGEEAVHLQILTTGKTPGPVELRLVSVGTR